VNWEFFLSLPEIDRNKLSHTQVKDSQLLEPLFEFSGACAGCGEDAVHQAADAALRRPAADRECDRLLLDLWRKPADDAVHVEQWRTRPRRGRIAVEDNAEFGLGMRLAWTQQNVYARELLKRLSSPLGEVLVKGLLEADQTKELGVQEQRKRVVELKKKLQALNTPEAQALLPVADCLVRKSVWLLAETVGPMTSDLADWITCWDRGATSMCWSWTRRCIPNTAVRCPRQRRVGAVAKFAMGGKAHREERPGDGSGQLRLCLRGARGAGIERHDTVEKRSRRRKRTTDPRSSSRTATALRTVTTCPWDWTSRRRRCFRGYWP